MNVSTRLFRNIASTISIVLLAVFAGGFNAHAQTASTANYTFAHNTTGSLALDQNGNAIDMTTGATNMGVSADDGASSVVNIGFDFFYMGTRYTQFSAASNGNMGLGGSATTGSIYSSMPGTAPTLFPFGSDLTTTGASDNIKYKLVGNAPNRTLVVQWIAGYSYSSGTPDVTFQARIYEGTGVIEYVYGAMACAITNTIAFPDDGTSYVGFYTGTANNTILTVSQSATPTVSTTTTLNSTRYVAAQPIPMNSAADGSRVDYIFLPPGDAGSTVATSLGAPTSLTVSTTTETGGGLTWTTPATTTGILGYAIYSSTDNVTFTYSSSVTGAATSTAAITGLTPSTTRYYKVLAYSEGALSAFSNSVTLTTNAPGLFTAIASGLWSQTSTWSTGALPSAFDSVIIPSGFIVTIDGTGTTDACLSAFIQGTLQYDATTVAKTLTVTHHVNIASGGVFQAGTGVATHILSVGGDFTNTGTVNFSLTTPAVSKVAVTFTGAQNNVFNCSANTSTNLFTVTEVKTANTNILDFTPGTAFTVSGANTAGFLTLTSGAFKLDGTATFSNPVFASTTYSVPTAAEFWLTNPNATVVGLAGNCTSTGIIRVTSGIYNIGTTAANTITGAAGQYIIEGGTINVAGNMQMTGAGTFNMSNGVLNVANVGNSTASKGSLDLAAADIFIMSGGTINIVNPSTGSTRLDYSVLSTIPANVNITGGTLNIGTVSGTAFNVKGAFPTTSISSITNKTVTMTAASTAYGTVTIPALSTLTLGAFTLTLNKDLVNNGTITAGVASSGLNFSGTVQQNLTGSTGTISNYVAGLTINNTSGATPGVNINQNIIVPTTFNLTAGSLGGTGILTLGNSAGTLTTTVANGSLATTPTFAITGATYNVVYNNSTAAYTTGFELAPDSVYTLTINNTSGVILNSPLAVKTNLVLTNGLITTSTINSLTLNTSVATPPAGSATSYVNGPLGISVNTAANVSKTFAIGKSGAFRPVVISNFESGGTLQTYTAEVINGASGGSGVTLDPARYYHLTNTANIFSTTTALLTLNYGVDDGITQATGIVAQSATAAGVYTSTGVSATTTTTITSSSAVIPGDDYVSLATGGPCAPPAQPTGLTLTNTFATTTTVNFTPAAPAPSGGYIVVASVGALTQTPVNATFYNVGATIGNGTVVGTGTASATSIVATLSGNTAYTLSLFPYNNLGCTGGPAYNTTSPLTTTLTTACDTLNVLSPTNITNTSFVLNWITNGTSSGTSTYQVDVSTSSTMAGDIAGFPVTVNGPVSSQAVTGLTTGTKYYYTVTSSGTCGATTTPIASIIMPVCTPVTLTPSSYNYDVIVNGNNNLTSVNNNTYAVGSAYGLDHGYSSGSQGTDPVSADYTNLNGTLGLPIGGSVAETNYTYGTPGIVYQFAPYFQNNALWFASGSASTISPSTATLTFATPIAAASVYVPYISGNGTNTVTYTVNFVDGLTPQVFSGIGMASWCTPLSVTGTDNNPVGAELARVLVNTTLNANAAACMYLGRNTLALSAANYNRPIASVTCQVTGSATSYPSIYGISVQQADTITTSVTALNFGTTANCAPSTPKYFTASGIHMNPASGSLGANGVGAVTVTAPAGYQVANGANGTYATTTTMAYINCAFTNDTVYVRANAPTPGIYPGNITFSGPGVLLPPTVALTDTSAGLVITPATATNFGNVQTGTSSAGVQYSFTGGNLTPGTITVSSSNPLFQVSPDNSTWSSSFPVTVSSATLAATSVWVRFSPIVTGVQNDIVSFSGAGTSACAQITATGNGSNNCITPTSPAVTTLSASSTTDTVRFTVPSPIPDGYLIVQSTAPFSGATTNGTEYTTTAGTNTIGNGTVVQKDVSASNAQPYVITGLTANTQYYFTLIPYNGGTTGTCGGGPLYGTPVLNNNITCAGTPGTPTASAVTASGFTITWAAPAGGTASPVTYVVDVAADGGFTTPIAGSPFTAATNSLTISNVSGTSFYFRVRAIGACTSVNSAPGNTTLPLNYNTVAIASGFNNDVIAEGSAIPSSTVTNPAGTPGANPSTPTETYFGSGYAFPAANYSYNGNTPYVNSPPVGGLITTNATTAGANFQLANYTGNNALTLWGNAGGTGTLTFATPVYASNLYLLGTATNANTLAATTSITITFTDATTQTGATWQVPDWFNSTTNVVVYGLGRVAVPGGTIDGTNSAGNTGNPRFYELPITIQAGNYGKKIQSITATIAPNSSIDATQEIALFAATVEDGFITPSVTSLPQFTNASGCASSAAQSFTILAGSLAPAAGNITATASTGYLVSNSSVGPFAATATFAYTNGGLANVPVYVKLDSSIQGSTTGSITFSGGTINSTPAQSVALTGVGAGLYIATAPAAAFGNVAQGGTSAPIVDTIKGVGIVTGGNIVVTSPNADFKVSLDGISYATSKTFAATSTVNQPIYIEVTPSVNGVDTSKITVIGGDGACVTPVIVASAVGTNACITPTTLPTALTFSGTTASSTAITFTTNGTPNGYLVLQGTAAFSGATVNGTNYIVGNVIGNDTVQKVINNFPPATFPQALTSQPGATIAGNTLYHITIIPFNGGTNGTCGGGPLYESASLTGSYTTCPAAPAFVASSVTVSGAQIRWASASGGAAQAITYTVDISTNNTFTADIAGYPLSGIADSIGGDVTTTVTGLTAGATYYYRIVANGACASTATTGQITTGNYCFPVFSNGCNDNDYIASFSFAGINISGGSNGNCVGNYILLTDTATVTAGIASTFNLTNGEGNGYDIYADLNNNGNFTDAGELIFAGTVATTATGSITIPTTVPSGAYRMRLVIDYNTVPNNPCVSAAYGDYMDFTLVVHNAQITTSVASLPAFSCAAAAAESFTVSGTNLLPAAGTMTATAPGGFLISSDSINYAATLSIPYTAATINAYKIYVEYNPALTGNPSGNVTFSGAGLTTPPSVAVTASQGTGLYVSPNNTIFFGNITQAVTSGSMVDTLKGTGISAGTITATSSNSHFTVSANNSTFGTSASFTATATLNNPLFIRFTPGSLGPDSTIITITGANGSCTVIPVIKAKGIGTAGCAAPTVLPTALTFPNTTGSGTGVTFTPNSTPDGYLVLQGSAPFTGSTVNGTTYTVGSPVGNAVVQAIINNNPPVTFPQALTSQTGALINGNTTYNVTIIPFNGGANGTCGGGPLYDASNVQGTYTTCPVAPVVLSTSPAITQATIQWASSAGGGVSPVTYTVDVSTTSNFASDITGYPITGIADSASHVTQLLSGMAQSTIYYYRITAVGSCNSATTGTFTTVAPCIPTFTSGNSGDYPTSIYFAGIHFTGNANQGGYNGQTSIVPDTATIMAGVTYTDTTNTQGYSGCGTYIDFNGDGIFQSNELVFNNYGGSALNTYIFPVFAPTSTPTGYYAMRVIDGNGGSNESTPCGTAQYGVYNDFTVHIINPTLVTSVDSLPAFTANACGFSGIQTFTLTGNTLLPNSGGIVVTAPSGFLVSPNNLGPNTYVTSTTFAYNNGTVPTQTIYVKFAPTVGSTTLDTGTITFSGASVLSNPYVKVKGNANGLIVTTATENIGSATLNTPSASVLDSVYGVGLTAGTVTVSSSNPLFQISPDNSTWSGSYIINNGTSLGYTNVYTRVTPTSAGAQSTTISFTSSAGAPPCTPTITVNATGTNNICAAPAAPANISFSGTNASGTTATITPNGTADEYLLVESVTPFTTAPTNGTNYNIGGIIANGTIVGIGATPSFSVTGLAGNSTYYFTAIAFNGGTNGSCGGGPLYSPVTTFATLTTCVGTPLSPNTTNTTSSGFTINWTDPSNGGASTLTYKIDISTSPTFTGGDIAGYPVTVSGTTTSLPVTGLAVGSTYYYKITSVLTPAIGACVNTPTATIMVSTTNYTYFPVPIASGFNSDVIANGNGNPATTTTVQDGSAQGGFSGGGTVFISSDYVYTNGLGVTQTPTVVNGVSYSLPASGSFTSYTTPGLPYQLANYSGNNAAVYSNVNTTGGSATLTFQTPVFADSLYVLATTAGGSYSTANITITYTDNTVETNNYNIGDWYAGTGGVGNPPVYQGVTVIGLVSVVSGLSGGANYAPTLWQQEIYNTSPLKQIKNVIVSSTGNINGSGTTYTGVFGVSAQGGTLNASVSSLPAFTGVCAAQQTFTINGSSLFPTGGSIVANAPTGFQVSADGNTWGSTATFTYAVNTLPTTTVYARINPTVSAGAESGNITFIGGTANNPPSIAVTGTGTGVVVTSTTKAFANQTINTTSASLNDTLSGTGLTAGTLTLTSSNADFKISLNGTTFSASTTVTVSGATLANTPIFIQFTPTTTTAETSTISITGAGNPCTTTITATGTGIPCVTGVWLGTTSNDWNTGSNWSCGTVPTSASSVTISATAPTMPSINSGAFTAGSLFLASNTTLSIASGATLSVTGAVTDSGAVNGAGNLALTGTTTQTYKGNGTVTNLTVNSTATGNAVTFTALSTLNLTGTMTMSGGTFASGSGGLVLVSNISGTARIAAITGGSITGIVKVQQYIPGGPVIGRRAFRFFGHPFSTSIPLSQLIANVDITGSGGGANGFTPTITNNPSAFWFNTLIGDNSTVGTNPGWVAFTSTNGSGANAWNAKEGIRLLVRGIPGQGLDGNPYTPSATTLNMSGTLNQGAITEPMTIVGTTSDYNLLSNPYPSPTDVGAVIANAGAAVSGSGFWVWNAEAALQGAYTTVPIGAGYYLPANASFTVKAATATALTFGEGNKGATATTALFKTTNMNNGIALHLYDTTMRTWDMLYVSFNGNAADSMENYDASHLHNPNLDFYSLSSNSQQLSIDARPYITGQVVPLGIATDVQQTYIIKAEDFTLTAGQEVYLHDKYLNQYEQLQDGSQYTFSITSDPASQGNNRFELSMAGTTTGINNVSGSNGLKVSMVPNPATEQVTISYEAPKSEKTSVRIMNMAGQEIINMELGDEQKGSVIIPLHNVAAGMYMVELISGSQVVTQRLVKQ